MSNKKFNVWPWVIGATVFTGVIIFLVFKKKKPAPVSPTGSTATDGNSSKDVWPLKKGSKGDHVRELQEALEYQFGNNSNIISLDGAGVWGDKTDQFMKEKIGLSTITTADQYYQILGDLTV